MTRRLYFVCKVNRTGSTWLCWMLRGTGVAGLPREFTTLEPIADQWVANRDTDPYGVKLSPRHLREVWPHVKGPDRRAARWVHLERRDTWRQAISQYRASSSGVWHVVGGCDPPHRHRVPEYDAERIQQVRRRLQKGNLALRRWFERRKIEPLRVLYEDLCREPAETVYRVLRHIGLPYSGPVDTGGGTRIMADDITEDWMRRLRADGHIK